MAAVPVTIVGIETSDDGSTRQVTIVGMASLTGLGVGGGPVGPPPGIWPSPGHPAHPIAPGGPPPGIWPSPGYPAHPIAPGGPPPEIWPSPGHPAHPIVLPPYPPGVPTHPIVLPGEPTHPIVIPDPPPVDTGVKPPPDGGGWAYVPTWGWGYYPQASDKPQPGGPEMPPAVP